MLRFPQQLAQLHVNQPVPGDTMTVFHPPRDISTIERILRWFFSVPQWIELSGAILALLVAITLVVIIWRQRQAVFEWARTRHLTTPIFWKIVIGFAAAMVLLAMAGGGASFFLYSQNNNEFCISCHTLHDQVYERFQGTKHHTVANLRCHDCHSEPLWMETRQIVYWVIYRPGAVGPHAPVPREVCARCHVQKNADSTWQQIIATAGHSVHLLSDTGKKLGIDCITCHGVSAHQFVPVKQTCQQSGCHEKTHIELGKMAGQTMLHCTVCHQFTAPIHETNMVELARKPLVPAATQCLQCHAMQKAIQNFVPANDPHKGECGDCHNPHTQTKPAQAVESCTNAGCHQRPDTLTPFHRGLHAGSLKNCLQCHAAHTWKVKGTQCLDCHKNVYSLPAKRIGAADAPRAGDLLASGFGFRQ
ncbi:MAG: NapC/NirT family cytochrome c [Gemmatimonadota bacterium]|nr:NapC/NirT family cytochrome c [Gemmatimonadota bacterium]HEU4990291.1 NapC/NirT family cytochrome c [Gemmatimonadaceae bacterium]